MQTVVAPLERVKIMYQVTNEHFSLLKLPNVILDILQKEGIFALWRGHSASLLRVVPYAGIQFMTYDYVRRQFLTGEAGQGHHVLKLSETMFCGGTAGAVSTSLTYPLDLARSRIAVTPPSHNVVTRFHVLRSLLSWYRFGGVPEVYKGLLPTLLGVIPYGAIAFSTNEAVKRAITSKYHVSVQNDRRRELNSWHKLFSGAIAGIIAQTCTYPLEIMRRRMQTAGHVHIDATVESTYTTVRSAGTGNKSQSKAAAVGVEMLKNKKHASMSMADTFIYLYNFHGWKVFYKGVSLNWIKGPITVSISFTSFDFFKTIFENFFHST